MESAAEIEIRTAGQDDAGGILKCLAAAFEPYRAEWQFCPSGAVWVLPRNYSPQSRAT
jgi:hypothetical protein